jgi:hypothetical protein
MAIVGMHRGAISGLTHVHLQRRNKDGRRRSWVEMPTAARGSGKSGSSMARLLAGSGGDIHAWNKTLARAEAQAFAEDRTERSGWFG